MDLQLLSATASPTLSTLLSDSTLDPMLYSIKSSYPLLSRQRVGIKAGTSWDFGKTNVFTLNRYGILVGLVAKIFVDGHSSAPVPVENFGHYLVKNASLTSHSREIEQLDSTVNLVRTMDMPLGAKESIMAVSNSNDVSGIDADGKYVYVPLHFSFTKNGLSSALDLQFVEQIECSVTLGAAADIFSANSGNAAITAANCELLCYYYNASEADLRSYEDKEFSLQKPLSMMLHNVYQEATTTPSATSSTDQQSSTISLNVPNVVTRTMITLQNTTDDGKGKFHAIDEIVFKISGREVYTATGDEIQKLENALFFGSAYGIGDIGGDGGSNYNENVYVHNFQVANERNRFCGGVSGKNCSDFSCTVKWTPADTSATNWEINVSHEYVQIVSVSGASGKIGVSLSL